MISDSTVTYQIVLIFHTQIFLLNSDNRLEKVSVVVARFAL